jgi:hypothetical protein
MASGNKIASIAVSEFVPDVPGPSLPPFNRVFDGSAPAIAFPHGLSTGATAVKRLSDTASLSTGATVKFLISDDSLNPNGALTYVVLGVSFGKLAASPNYYQPTPTNVGTEATATVLLPTTPGQTLEVSIPVVVANMLGCVASAWTTIRVRRLGANASDTGKGRLLIIGEVAILDT